MAYRDELQAAQARAIALEHELQEAQAELAALKGNRSAALVVAGRHELATRSATNQHATRWLGAPVRLSFTRTIDGEVPEDAYTELVECIRTHLGDLGAVSTLKGSLTWASTVPSNGVGRFVSVRVSSRDDQTTIAVDERLGNLAGSIFGGVGGGVGGGGLMAPIAVAWLAPPLVALTVPLWLGGIYGICRKLYRSRASSRANTLQELTQQLVTIAESWVSQPSQ